MSDTPSPESSSPPRLPSWIGWTLAAFLLFVVFFFAAKSFNVRNELQLALVAEQAARLEAGTLKNLLEAERLLSRAQLDRLAAAETLVAGLRAQADPASLRVFTLKPSSAATGSAVVVWNPDRQEGILVAPAFPPPASGKDYQLWIADSPSSAPANGGVFTVDADTGAIRATFKPDRAISADPVFFVSIEPQGGSSKPEGPRLLAGN